MSFVVPINTALTPADVYDRAHAWIGQRSYVRAKSYRVDPEEAEQEAWVLILRYLYTFDPDRGALTTWLTRVVETACWRMANARSKRRPAIPMSRLLLAGEEAFDFPGGEPDPSDAANVAEILACVDGLPDEFRNLIRRRLAGETLSEIGEREGIDRPVIYYRYSKAQAALRVALAADCGMTPPCQSIR